MKTRPEIEVFDGDYCRGESEFCGKLFRSSGIYYCGLYDRQVLEHLEMENHGIYPIKCDQCKADCVKAKEEVKEIWLGI